MKPAEHNSTLPTAAGVSLGIGMGGFFDGIVLHQLLQWHHLVSRVYPPVDPESLRQNAFWDGIFHSGTYVFVALGVILLWRARQSGDSWPWSLLIGSILMGFGAFNLVEGTLNHLILELHHVNETAPVNQWVFWDIGFLVWGALMFIAGAFVIAVSKRRLRRSDGG